MKNSQFMAMHMLYGSKRDGLVISLLNMLLLLSHCAVLETRQFMSFHQPNYNGN